MEDKQHKTFKALTSIFNNLKSAPSASSVLGIRFIEDIVDFGDVILTSVQKFECPIYVDVCRKMLDHPEANSYPRPERKMKLVKSAVPMLSTFVSTSEDKATDSKDKTIIKAQDTKEDDVLMITAVHSPKNRLEEVAIIKYRFTHIPRVLMQVLHFILPNYSKLTKFTIKDCLIDKYTIPELANILKVTNITEVCLDFSDLPELNYDVLLHQATSLKHLSLKVCNINDVVCKKIVSKLHYQQPAEIMLQTLNLSSNQITDEGAKSIGEALRSNRHLRYLNLADNFVTDLGAKYIFDLLKEFSLTNDESYQRKEQRMNYLKLNQAASNKRATDFENNSVPKVPKVTKSLTGRNTSSRVSVVRSSKSSVKLDKQKISLTSEGTIADVEEPYEHPFNKSHLTINDGVAYCQGNFVLSYLNVAYNSLTYQSIKLLLEVLEYQKQYTNDNLSGLIKVVLDGNNLPVNCAELDGIKSILAENNQIPTRTRNTKGGVYSSSSKLNE